MASVCLVSAADYARYFTGASEGKSFTTSWNGVDRRTGLVDRRVGHDRRWEQSLGRRYRLSDRRQSR